MRYTAHIADRISIPIYGPEALSYVAHPAVESRLTLAVTLPQIEGPGSEEIDDDDGVQVNIQRLARAAPELTPRLSAAPLVVYADHPYSTSLPVKVFEGEPDDFTEIEHEGLIVGFGEASVLEVELFDSVGGLAEELGIQRLPIYVHELGRGSR
jgi:hypothetical protein